MRRLLACLVPVVACACTSANFDVQGPGDDAGSEGDTLPLSDAVAFDSTPSDSGPTSDAPTDGGGVDTGVIGSDSGAIDGGAIDGGVIDTGVIGGDGGSGDAIASDVVFVDVIVPDASTGCTPLASSATEVFVGNRSTKPSVGTVDCPFHSILEATSLSWSGAGTRTIHVLGASGSTTDYLESGAVEVRANVRLQGDGNRLNIGHGGPCPGVGGGTNCIVTVDAGGTLDGFTVSAGSGHAVVTGVGAPSPVVRNVIAMNASGTGSFGFWVRGGAELGPNIVAINDGVGLDSSGNGTVHVLFSAGADNRFDNNAQTGLLMEGAATLVFEGGSVSKNGSHGIRFGGAPTGTHSIGGLTAIANASAGILVGNNASLVLRRSTLKQNRIGLVFVQGFGNSVDLGRAGDPGGNVFAGATHSVLNSIAGVCLEQPRGTVQAQGDSWGACPVAVTNVGGCDLSGGSYADLYVHPPPTLPIGASVDTSGCATGP